MILLLLILCFLHLQILQNIPTLLIDSVIMLVGLFVIRKSIGFADIVVILLKIKIINAEECLIHLLKS